MFRIIICFIVIASAFAFPANAQDGQKVPGMLDSQPVSVPSPKTDWKTAPDKVDLGPRPSQVQQERGSPAPDKIHIDMNPLQQPAYGVNPHLVPAGEEKETAAETDTGETPPPQGDFAELSQMDTASVDQVIDPLRIRLKNRRIIQLAGIAIPDLDAYEPGEVSIAARDYLDKLLANRQVRLYQTKQDRKGRVNRMGYHLGHLVIPGEETWVQGALLVQGLAMVRPGERNPEMAAQMIALEDAARAAKKGLWADGRHALLTPETAAKGLNNWGMVEGRVHAAAMNQNVLYLNFGPDWRSDFTIVVNGDVRRDLTKRGIDPLNLGGKTVRARGWLEDYNGPSLELANAVWLEVISAEDSPTGHPERSLLTPAASKGAVEGSDPLSAFTGSDPSDPPLR